MRQVGVKIDRRLAWCSRTIGKDLLCIPCASVRGFSCAPALGASTGSFAIYSQHLKRGNKSLRLVKTSA